MDIVSISLTEAVLKSFPNPVFVETGTAFGGGVVVAHQCGFSTIHSIEAFPDLHAQATLNVGHLPGVHLHLGDSSQLLPQLLPTITEPCTFWLDAHYNPDITPVREGNGWKTSPLLLELQALADFALIGQSTVLIDDFDLIEMPVMGSLGIFAVRQALFKLNPKATQSFLTGCRPNSILTMKP